MKIILLILLTIYLYGCNRFTPSGFWKNYETKFIVNQNDDQGPWGGMLWIHWENDKINTFSEEELINFANTNGWEFLDKKEYTSKDLEDWQTFNHTPVFILFYPEHSFLKRYNAGAVEKFPRHINDDLIVLKFNTDWIRVKAGTDETEEAFGYILINKLKNKIAMYHLWGES